MAVAANVSATQFAPDIGKIRDDARETARPRGQLYLSARSAQKMFGSARSAQKMFVLRTEG